MPSIQPSRPQRTRARVALTAALVAVGCSGGAGGGCGSSCGGAFHTVDVNGNPIHFSGQRLENAAQVRLTTSGFSFLNAQHLNDILGALNQGAAGGFTIPCNSLAGVNPLLNACLGSAGFYFSGIIADQNFNDVCDAGEGAKLYLTFKDVTWSLDGATNTLRAHVVSHIKTGDVYVHTIEDHSTICGGYPALMRAWLDDENPGLQVKDTTLDLDLQFSTAPDGRLQIDVPDSSLQTILQNFQPGAFFFDGHSGSDPAAPTANVGVYRGDGCNSGAYGNYTPSDGTNLNGGCASLVNDLSAGCNFSNQNQQGVCLILDQVRSYLLDYVKNTFRNQITAILRKQLDGLRCQRAVTTGNLAVACDAQNPCPADDDGDALACDTSRGVCYPPAQGTAGYNCEPVALGVTGQLDVSDLTRTVGFPAGTRLNLFAGLGSKGTNGGARVDGAGVQIAAEAGTAAASDVAGLCAPTAGYPVAAQPPPMNFDDPAALPSGVTGYDVGFSLASAMLNRGFVDAYNAGMLCVAVTNRTTSFISSGLFKTFLPSLDLVTGGKDVPMMILLRPTQPPSVRIGRNTANADGSIADPLLTLSFRQLNLDFYALIDERQVRMFTLQSDVQLPLDLRTFPAPDSDRLQPVLGGLGTLLTNISALSPEYGAAGQPAYGPSDMLAEDPGVVKDLLKAALGLAQPLLAGVIKPIALPSMLGLRVGVQGIAGAVPGGDTASGYDHLAIWAKVSECGGTTGLPCAQKTVRTQASIASSVVPRTVAELRGGVRPSVELSVSAEGASKPAQFSYRVDGSLWSQWLPGPRFVIENPLFLVQGHHRIEVTARESGDDHTMDPSPAVLDFFVSYEAPSVLLAERADGAVITTAQSAAGPLLYSYRLEGDGRWSEAGPARVWTPQDLAGRGLEVTVTDASGRASVARFGMAGESAENLTAAGCSTSAHAPAWFLLPLLWLLMFGRRRRRD